MKSVSIKIQFRLSKRDRGIVNDKIHKLENYSCQLISMSFELSQDQTVSFLKEARIGGYSIIGELITGDKSVILHRNYGQRLPSKLK